MLIEILLTILIGTLFGTLTGLTPGVHINLIAAILVSSTFFLSTFPPIYLIVFIISLSITHTFLDMIPSILLGAPEEDSFLSILPGHEMLIKGQGPLAIGYTLLGSILALFSLILIFPIMYFFSEYLYETLKFTIPFILIFTSLYIILRDEKPFQALTIFLMAGFLGLFSFNLPIKDPLLPLLTGLFGLSTIMVSIKNKTKIPQQNPLKIKDLKTSKKSLIQTLLLGNIFSPIFSFLPGTGTSQAAIISSEIKNQSKKEFLTLLGMINTLVMIVSFITILTINRARTGSAAALVDIINPLPNNYILILILTTIISGLGSLFLGIKLSNILGNKISKINYTKLSYLLILFIILINLLITNTLGIVSLITSTSLGVFCILSKSKRINLMGVLIIPTIINYLF